MFFHSWVGKAFVIVMMLSMVGQLAPLPVFAAQTVPQSSRPCDGKLPLVVTLDSTAVAQLKALQSGQQRTFTSDGVTVTLQNNRGVIQVTAISGFPHIKNTNALSLVDISQGIKIIISALGTASIVTTPSAPAQVYRFQNPPLPNRFLSDDGKMWQLFARNILKELSMMEKASMPFAPFQVHVISSQTPVTSLSPGNHMLILLPGVAPFQFSVSAPQQKSKGIITNGISQYVVEDMQHQPFIVSSATFESSFVRGIKMMDVSTLSYSDVALFLAALGAEKQLGNSLPGIINLSLMVKPTIMPYQFSDAKNGLPFVHPVYAQEEALEGLLKAFADTAEAAQGLEAEAAKDPTKARAIARQLLRLWQKFGKLLKGLKPNEYIAFKKLGDTLPVSPTSAAAPRVLRAIKWVTGPVAVALLVLDMQGTAHADEIIKKPSACSANPLFKGSFSEDMKLMIQGAVEQGAESAEMFGLQKAGVCVNNSCATSCVVKKEERKLLQDRRYSSSLSSSGSNVAYDQELFSNTMKEGSAWNPLNWNVWSKAYYQDVYYCSCR